MRTTSRLSPRPRILGIVASALVGCAGAPSPVGSAERGPSAVASLHASRCGQCHTAPAPKTRTREYLEGALSRHRRRVHLTHEEWAALTEYLALPDGSTARQP